MAKAEMNLEVKVDFNIFQPGVTLEAMKLAYIRSAYEYHKKHLGKTASALGISRGGLFRILKSAGVISPPTAGRPKKVVQFKPSVPGPKVFIESNQSNELPELPLGHRK